MNERMIRLSILLTRISGVAAGLLFLFAAALLYARTGVLNLELLGVGVVFPVAMLWMARVMQRSIGK